MKLVIINYQWPEVIKNVEKDIKRYDYYQRMENKIEIPVEKLMMNEVLEKPQTYLIVDFITKVPLVIERDVILVVCNRLLKMTYFVITTEGTTVEELARLFRDNMWKLYRLPESVILYRRLQFVVELTKKLN